MKNLTKKITAAATAASTTVLAVTTVAMETATAAIFTHPLLGGELSVEYDGTLAEFSGSQSSSWQGVSWVPGSGAAVGPIDFSGPGSDGEFVGNWERRHVIRISGDGSSIDVRFAGNSWGFGGDNLSGASFQASAEGGSSSASVPEPSSAIALGVLGLGAVASRLRRRSK